MSVNAVSNALVLVSLFAIACSPAAEAGAEGATEPVSSATTSEAVLTLPTAMRLHATAVDVTTQASTNVAPAHEAPKHLEEITGRTREPLRADSPASLFGKPRTWKIDGHVFATFSAFSNDEADALDGHYVLSNGSMVTPWERCDAPRSVYRDATPEEWFSSFDDRGLSAGDRDKLGMPHGAVIRVHDLTCRSGEAIEIVEIGKGDLVIVRDGVAFRARAQ